MNILVSNFTLPPDPMTADYGAAREGPARRHPAD